MPRCCVMEAVQMTTPKRILFAALPRTATSTRCCPWRACRDAGHEVHIATGGDFVRRLRGLGFSTHAVGMPIEQAHEIRARAAGNAWPPAR